MPSLIEGHGDLAQSVGVVLALASEVFMICWCDLVRAPPWSSQWLRGHGHAGSSASKTALSPVASG